MTVDETIEALVTLDVSLLDDEKIQKLLKMAPTEEECKILNDFRNGKHTELSP